MDFFSRLFNSQKDIILSIDFSKYPETRNLSRSEINHYNQIRQVINNALNEYSDFYRGLSEKYTKSYGKRVPSGEANKPRLLEMTAFTWTVIQQVFLSKELPRQVGVALYLSIEEAFIDLTKDLNEAGYKDFDTFFQGRGNFYLDMIDEIFENSKTIYTYSTLQNIIMINPLNFILNNDPSNIAIQVGNPILLMDFSDFITKSLAKSDHTVAQILS